MNKYNPDQLRVYVGEESSTESCPPIPPGFAAVFREFENLTGWKLGFCEAPASSQRRAQLGLSPSYADGSIFVEDLSATIGPSKKAVDRTASDRLAHSLTLILRDLVEMRLQMIAATGESLTEISRNDCGSNESDFPPSRELPRLTSTPMHPQFPDFKVLSSPDVSTL